MIFSLLISHSYSLKTTVKNFINLEDSIILRFEFDTLQEMIDYLDKKYIEINFDDEKFSYNKLNYEGSLRKTSVTGDIDRNKLDIKLIANKDYCKLKYKLDIPEIIEVKFKVVDKNIPVCKTPIIVNSVNPKRKTIKRIHEISLEIGNPDVDKCKLKNLIPDIGSLTPDFNPEVHEYDMTVDCNVKSLDFEAIPMLENLDVKVAHRNLSAPGKYTDVTITVSHPDLKLKETYTVHVYREDKVEEVKEKSKKSKKQSSKSNTKNKSLESSNNKTKQVSMVKSNSNKEINEPELIVINDNSNDKTSVIEEEKNVEQEKEQKQKQYNINKYENNNEKSEEYNKHKIEKIESNSETNEEINNNFSLYLVVILIIAILSFVLFWILNRRKLYLRDTINENSREEDK